MRDGGFGQGTLKPAFAANPEPPLGPLICALSKHEFDQTAREYRPRSFITDCRTVASYNWLDRTEPTIVIPAMCPGLPPPIARIFPLAWI